jgi:hypothetical protein
MHTKIAVQPLLQDAFQLKPMQNVLKYLSDPAVPRPSLEELKWWQSRKGPKLRALIAAQEDHQPPVR